MMGFASSDDYQPLFWVRGRPVHVTTLIVVTHILTMIGCCLIRGLGNLEPMTSLGFDSSAVLGGQIWRVFTYAFVHFPSLWFAVNMFFLFFFGREVERYFGRKVFASLYVGLLFTAPVVLLCMHFFMAPTRVPLMLVDSSVVDFGVFLVFVTIYPSVQFFFGIAAVWLAAASLAIYTLAFFAYHQWSELTALWSTAATAFLGTRYASMGSEAFAFFNLRQHLPPREAPRGVKPRLQPRRAVDTPAHAGKVVGSLGSLPGSVDRGEDVHESIDPLLDKISKHGLASLTNSERAALERARVSLLRKERGG